MPPEGGPNYVLQTVANGHGENTMWVFPKIVFSPQIIHFNRGFHYFHHPFWGTIIFGNIHVWLGFIDLKENRMLFSCHIVGCLLYLRVPSGWTHINHFQNLQAPGAPPKSHVGKEFSQKTSLSWNGWDGGKNGWCGIVVGWGLKLLNWPCFFIFIFGGVLELLFTWIGNQQIKAGISVSPRNTKTNLAGGRKEAKVPVIFFIVLRAKDLAPGFLTAS